MLGAGRPATDGTWPAGAVSDGVWQAEPLGDGQALGMAEREGQGVRGVQGDLFCVDVEELGDEQRHLLFACVAKAADGLFDAAGRVFKDG